MSWCGVAVRNRLVLLVAVVLAAGACGGSSEIDDVLREAASGSSNEVAVTQESSGDGDGFVVADGTNEVVVGSTDRPDWLPPWVLLPPGLDVTTTFNSPGTGEAAVMGSLAQADAQQLYDQASFMVQSGGYVLGDQYDVPGGSGFTAEHTSDGSRVVFGVAEISADFTMWSMEFSSATDSNAEEAEGETASGPTDRGFPLYGVPGTATVTVAGETFTVDGGCDLYEAEGLFAGRDGVTRFVVDFVDGGDPVPSGDIAQSVDGEVVAVWSASPDSAVASAGVTVEGFSYEGELSLDGRKEMALVTADC